MTLETPPSLWRAALLCRCPRCGDGPIFSGILLKLRPACPVCGLDLSKSDTGDATAVPMVMILGTILVVMALWVEFHFSPPIWVHIVVWPIVSLPLAVALMRPLKAFFVAQQYRVRSREMGL